MLRTSYVHRRLGVASFAWLAACQGVLSGSHDDALSADLASADLGLGDPPLRRLSHEEYRNTLVDLFPNVALPEIALPADDKPYGFNNDAQALGASSLLTGSYEKAAFAIAGAVSGDLSRLAPCEWQTDPDCYKSWLRNFGRRAFRRPLLDEEAAAFEPLNEAGMAPASAVTLAIATMLQSPQFLYRLELPELRRADGSLNSYQTASRLSYFLWGTMPDEELFAVAEADGLRTAEQVEEQARRMLEDERAQRRFASFHAQWLDTERLRTLTKKDADWDEALQRSAAEEVERFTGELLFRRDGSLSDLLVSSSSVIDARLAALYGVSLPSAEPVWQEVDLGAERAGGLLGRAAFLAGYGHYDSSAPILRGVFLIKRVLCINLGAPPPEATMAAIPAAGGAGAPQTVRAATDVTTASPACSSCHRLINPSGYPFEHFDQLGRYRGEDNGIPVDASGALPNGTTVRGLGELGAALAADAGVERCLTQQWLRFAYGGGVEVDSEELIQHAQHRFADTQRRLRQLLLAIVSHPRFHRR